MLIDTQGLINPKNRSGTEFILLALYKNAIIEKFKNNAEIPPSILANIVGYGDVWLVKAKDLVINAIHKSNFNFTDINLSNCVEGKIKLNIDLTNTESFDSEHYDQAYGCDVAEKLISNLKNDEVYKNFIRINILIALYQNALIIKIGETVLAKECKSIASALIASASIYNNFYFSKVA